MDVCTLKERYRIVKERKNRGGEKNWHCALGIVKKIMIVNSIITRTLS